MRLHAITDFTADDLGWSDATWIGEVDEQAIVGSTLQLIDGARFHRARLLVWRGDQPRGFVDIAAEHGLVAVAELRESIGQLPQVAPDAAVGSSPPISVVVYTDDRPDQLRNCLGNLAELEYAAFEILVVDGNSASGLTAPVVESFHELPIRLVDAGGRGISAARNAGIEHARYDIVAFTMDDAIVDRRWLAQLARGFSRADSVACVCGLVPTAEVLTPAQSYIDHRMAWARRCHPMTWQLSSPRADDSLFPLSVAEFGTGANLAVRKDVVPRVGGFDEGLGEGSPVRGGEDVDFIARVLLGGHAIVRQPSAVVWSRVRPGADDVELQATNYGRGLGAWTFKSLVQRETALPVLRRLRRWRRHLREVARIEPDGDATPDPVLGRLRRREMRGLVVGPLTLAVSRMLGRKPAPLKVEDADPTDPMVVDPSGPVSAGAFALAAVAFGLIGAAGAVHVLPSVLLAVAVAAFVLLGPGSLVLSWYARLPAYAVAALVPAVGLAICLLVVSGLLMAGFYHPVSVLLGLTSVTAVGGLARWAYLERRRRSVAGLAP
jgi:GT2 family glycosyltransferase